MENKVLLIGLDGATFDLIKPWASQGKLPTFTKLLQEGTHGNLKSVPNTNSAPAWVSFATGNNPGKHGIFYFVEPIFGTYQMRYLNGSFRKSKAIWNYVSEAGKKVGVINVPMTYPAERTNGFMIAGVDTPGIWSKGFTYPHSLANELRVVVEDYIIEPGIPGLIKAGKKDLSIKRLFETIDKRYAYTKYLLNYFPWDLFIVVFTVTDVAQHFFWKYMDSSHPEYNEEDSKLYGSTIFKVYQKLDQVISSLLEQVDNSTVIVMSDHGAGFNQRGAEYLNTWLAEMGLLRYKSFNRFRKNLIRGIGMIYHLIDKLFSRETKLKLVKIFPGLREKVEAATCFSNIDWSATKAYSDGARDEIWINLKGREPQGIVQPGEEYEKLCDFIIKELSNCCDVENGKKVVKKVYKRKEIYWGKYVFKAPDIFIQWQHDFIINGLRCKNRADHLTQKSFKFKKPPLNNGGHRENGIFITYGLNIKKNCEIRNAKIVDLAPTILYLLDISVPKDMDGRVLTEAIDESFLHNHPISYEVLKTKTTEGEKSYDYSEAEAEKIRDRLKGMGYID